MLIILLNTNALAVLFSASLCCLSTTVNDRHGETKSVEIKKMNLLYYPADSVKNNINVN